MSQPSNGSLQQQMTSYWDWRGGDYDAQPRHGIHHAEEKQAWLDSLRELFGPPAQEILDVGCGTGFLALLLAELGHRVTGVDLSEGMLAVGREAGARLAMPPRFLCDDAQDLGMPPHSVDAITNRHVMWTLLDPERALRSWYTALRPGGRLIAIDGLWWLETAEVEVEQRHEMTSEVQQRYRAHYNQDVELALPLRKAQSIADIEAMVMAAGFVDVHHRRLEHIAEVERRLHTTAEHATQPRYVLIGTRPKTQS